MRRRDSNSGPPPPHSRLAHGGQAGHSPAFLVPKKKKGRLLAPSPQSRNLAGHLSFARLPGSAGSRKGLLSQSVVCVALSCRASPPYRTTQRQPGPHLALPRCDAVSFRVLSKPPVRLFSAWLVKLSLAAPPKSRGPESFGTTVLPPYPQSVNHTTSILSMWKFRKCGNYRVTPMSPQNLYT